jgi:hypothetical protein
LRVFGSPGTVDCVLCFQIGGHVAVSTP